MFSAPPQLLTVGPTEPPSKRRRIDSRSRPRGFGGGSSFRKRVTGIVGKNKISPDPVGSVADGGVGDGEKRAQKKIDEYFGWGAGSGIDEELAGILEGVMGGVELGGDVEGYNGQGREWEEEGEGEVGLLADRPSMGVENLTASVDENGDGDGVMKDNDVAGEDVGGRGNDSDHYEGMVYAWLNGSGYNDDGLGTDVTNEDDSKSEAVGPEGAKEEREVPRKAREDLAAMVKRLSKSERRERKEQKRKKNCQKAGGQDEESEEDLDLLFGKRIKRRRESSADGNGFKKRPQLTTPESPDDSSIEEGPIEPPGTPKTSQPSQSQHPTRPFNFGPHFFTPETSDRYTQILNSTIQGYLAHAIYPSGGEDGGTARLDSAPLGASYVLGSYWTSDEKQQFFNHLATKGRHDLPGISEGIGTKSIVEVRAYLKALEEGLRDVKLYVRRLEAQDGGEQIEREEGEGVAQGSEEVALVRYEDIPAAVEISGELEVLMEKHAEKLEKEMLEDEVKREKEKWGGGRWLVGFAEAEKMDEFWAENSKDRNIDQSVPSPPPGTELFKTHSLLRLSQAFFMLPKPFPNNPLSAINGDGGAPAIRLTTLLDLHNLALSMTQKLVQASIFIAKNRMQSSLLSEKLVPSVRVSDVRVAARVMGLGEADKKGFWVEWVRRSGVGVRDRRGKEMEPEHVERELLSKKGDLKKRNDTQQPVRGEEGVSEEVGMTTGGKGEGTLDEDGDREMGEAPPPPDNVADLVGQSGTGEEEEGDGEEIVDDSEDSEHALEDAVHTQAEELDLIASAKAELALWKELLPEHVSPPEKVTKQLQYRANKTLAADTYPSSSAAGDSSSLSGHSERSLSESEASNSTSDSTSASDASATSDTTPASTTFIVTKQAKRQRRRGRLLEDWDEDWVDSYPYYAAWAARFKRPDLGVGYDFAEEAEGSWSGDDDDVTDTSSTRRFGEKGRRGRGKGKGKRKGKGGDVGMESNLSDENRVENSPQPLQEQQNIPIISSDPDPLQHQIRGRGRPRKYEIKFDAQGIPIRNSKSDRPIGRPRLTKEKLLEHVRSKPGPGRRRKGPFEYLGLEGRHIPDVRWKPDGEEIEDEDTDEGVGEGVVEDAGEGIGEDVEMTGGVGKEVGEVTATRVNGGRGRGVERVRMVSTVQAVIGAGRGGEPGG